MSTVSNPRAAGAAAGGIHPAEAVVRRLEGVELGEHPLFRRMREEPLNRAAVWLVLNNVYAVVSGSFAGWLAHLVTAVEDERIRSIVVKQLNDELGDGDASRMHRLLFDRFIAGIESWRPEEGVSLAPGYALGDGIRAHMTSPDAYCRVGGVMASEIFAKKFDFCVAHEIDRQHELSDATLEWLRIHLSLEVGHADSSLELAHLLPTTGPTLTSALQGAEGTWQVFMTFMDDMHRLCYA